jgi:hypothetical protein
MSADEAPAPTVMRPPEEMTRAEQHLHLHLQRFSFCLDRYDARFGTPPAGVTPPTAAERDRRIQLINDEVAELDAYIAAAYPDEDLPLARLQSGLGLDAAAIRLLVGAAASALDLSLSRRIAGFCGRTQPQAGFLVDMLAASAVEERACLAALRPTAPLARWRLVKLGETRDWSPETPTLHSPMMAPARMVDWLRGEVGFDPERFARAGSFAVGDPQLVSPSQREAMARALFREGQGRRAPLIVAGPSLAGKATAVRAAAATRNLPVLDVDLETVAEASAPPELLADLAREAMLRGAVLLLRHADLLAERHPELRRGVTTLLADGALWSVATVRGEPGELLRRIPGAQVIEVALPSQHEQLSLWQASLPPSVPMAPDVALPELVRRYHLMPGDILAVGNLARGRARVRGEGSPITLDDVVTEVRGRLRHRLGEVAELMTTTLTWNDVILPEQVELRVTELITTIDRQRLVMEQWGFNRKVAYGRAVSALFSGPPGTGKTMVATLIAKELGLELFRVDLSRVVSKWVGETEKNLGRAFDEARQSQAVLLFDEADALFAKRTDVKSSNDRYANLEVNYLLQRLESFEGIVLLTTNNQAAIDDAFRRRLRFRIEFATPEQPEREQLWRSMFPPGAPLADDVGFAELASHFEMSGGYIKNAVVRAAFFAAAEDPPLITHDLLMRAAHLEWEEMGRLTRS